MTTTKPRLKEMLSFAPPRQALYGRKTAVFDREYLTTLKQAILTSPYLAASQLSDNFAGSRGFSVVFKRSGIPQVIDRFPEFEPYLTKALKSGCNAFYLNPLVLEQGGDVKPHVDCSISGFEMVMSIPRLVSVLYVQVGKDIQGGELVLEDAVNNTSTAISPQENTLLHFLGNLTHSVRSFQSSQTRISLICEQYNLSPERLEHIPEFEVFSAKTNPLPLNRPKPPQLSYQIDNFLTEMECDRLLRFAIENESDFSMSEVEIERDNPKNGQYRHSLVYQPDLNEFSDLISDRLREIFPDVLASLNIADFPLAGIEIQLTAHNDGHYFRLHQDNGTDAAKDRRITFVYYFHQSKFTGGELRIFNDSAGAFELITPRHNSIVFFRSELLHEVLPINCPSGAFEHSRFTANGWIWQQPATAKQL